MTLPRTQSEQWLKQAVNCIPGGVNSPVRAFGAVGGKPPFIARGDGAHIWDVDGNRFIDYVGSWGPLIFGHRHPPTMSALSEALSRGTSFGAPTAAEVTFAELIGRCVPSIEKVRLVSSGTEATMSAIRLARGYTRRDVIIKIDGGYHGHADGLLVKAGSGAQTFSVPDSAGVPESVARHTWVAPFNNLSAIAEMLSQRPNDVAAIILEPVPGNMGVVAPQPGYLAGLRDLTTKANALLIFDEVMSGFRVALGGAQEHFQVRPDLTCLGKIIGGGLPVGAYGGRTEIMKLIAPEGPVYQAGTLSGNPLAVTAGTITLSTLRTDPPYSRLDQLTRRLEQGLLTAAQKAGRALWINRVGSMITPFFCKGPVIDLATAKMSDLDKFSRFHGAMLEQGIYLPPSQFESWFVSAAHSEALIDETVDAASRAFSTL